MANYSAIKAAVNAYIKANGKKEITGRILNSVLNATIDSLGRFFQFAGEAIPTDDPGTPDQNVCYLATEPGLYTHFGNIRIANEEVALLFWNGEWVKESIALGIQEVNASVDNQVGTPSVDVSYSGGQLVLTFHNLKGEQGIQGIQGIQGERGIQGEQGIQGETGDAAGFGTIGADITGDVGTPGVSVETSGDNTSKNIMFHFTNLKGETGVTSVVATIDDTSGTPSCQVSLVNGVLTLAFSGLKGIKGDTGVSADYPITLYNGLDSDATDQALAAAQGKVLDGKISQLRQEVADDISQLGQKVSELPLQLFDGVVNGYNVWQLDGSRRHFLIPTNGGESVVFDSTSNYMYCAFLKTYTTPIAGATPDFCTGYESRQGRNEASGAFNLPEDCRYFVINIGESQYIPTKLEINGVDIVNGAYGGMFNVGEKITRLDNESVKNDDINEGVVSINLADPEGVIDGKFINSAGTIGTNASWAMLKIPAVPGKYYTIGGLYLGRSVYYAFYDSSDSLISFQQISDPNGRVSPQTTTIAPANTAYLYVDIKTNSSPSNPYQYMQVNEGTYLQPYSRYVGGVVRVFDKKIVGEDYELGKVVSGALFRNPEKHNDFVNTGYVAWGTGALSGGGYGTTDFIPVKEGETVVVKDLNASSSVAGLSAYSSDSESSYLQLKSVKGTNSEATFDYVVPNGVNYIRLSKGNSNTIAEYGIIQYVPYLSKDDVANDISSADEKIATIGIVKEQTTQKAPVRLYPQTKLPCVSFQFDDCPNSDSDVVTLFDSYGLTCAFAFIASEENIVGKAERYRFYQQKGFQIMNHSVDGTIFNTTNYTYETALYAIMTALNRIQKAGMVCNGFVSPSSAMATEFMPILKQAHAYAFTSATSNPGHNGRTADTCDLHRFNIQATPIADIKQYIDDCITQDRIMTFYGHAAQFGTTYSGEEWNLEKVASVIEYCITKRDAGLLYIGGTDDCVKYFFDL